MPAPKSPAAPPVSAPLITIHLPPPNDLARRNQQTFAVYAVLALVCGYAAERLLGRLMEDISNRMYQRADTKSPMPADAHPAKA